MKLNKFVFLAIVCCLLILAGCGQKKNPTVQGNVDWKNANIILTIDLMEPIKNKIGFKVYFDDKLYIDEPLSFHNRPVKPSNFKNYSFVMSEGVHKIKVETEDGAKMEGEFTVDRKCHYPRVSYSKQNNIPKIQFQYLDSPPLYD